MSDQTLYVTDEDKLSVAIGEALTGLAEGGIPIGAALFDEDGRLLGSGHNQRVQGDNPALHGETAAFLNAGRQRSYRRTTMVTTLSPCWYCSGLVRQFGIGRVVVGDTVNFFGGQDWLEENGTEVTTLNDPELIKIMGDFIVANPALWNEDIGEE
jgi:cytosine/creatinine deaminase